MARCDLNADLGESFGAWVKGSDSRILQLVTSANIACGMHASDPCIMLKTVEMASAQNVAIGAHPGYPDLVGFGRRAMALTPREVYAYVIYQIGALDACCKVKGTKLHHVKPHGSLYNRSALDYECAKAIAQAVYNYNNELILFGLAGSASIEAANSIGLRTAREFFADRAYTKEGTLVPRDQEGACIHDPQTALERTLLAVTKGVVITADNTEIPISADTVCLHGDGEQALAFAKTLREGLISNGIEVTACP